MKVMDLLKAFQVVVAGKLDLAARRNPLASLKQPASDPNHPQIASMILFPGGPVLHLLAKSLGPQLLQHLDSGSNLIKQPATQHPTISNQLWITRSTDASIQSPTKAQHQSHHAGIPRYGREFRDRISPTRRGARVDGQPATHLIPVLNFPRGFASKHCRPTTPSRPFLEWPFVGSSTCCGCWLLSTLTDSLSLAQPLLFEKTFLTL